MPSDPQPFTEADVQLVARAINSASGYHYADEAETWAPYVLQALAEAGRLVPDGARPADAEALEDVAALRRQQAYTFGPNAWGLRALDRIEKALRAGPRVEADGTA